MSDNEILNDSEDGELMNLVVGTIESKKLEPASVKIVGLSIRPVGKDKKFKQLVCESVHPGSDSNIKISGVKWINRKTDKVEVVSLWVNKDADGKLGKGSGIAELLSFTGSICISDLMGKELSTVLDENGYLVFKIYN